MNDIRNIYPEVEDTIIITGDITKILNDKQFKELRDKHKLVEFGYDGYVSYIKLQYLFTLDDIKKKIYEILKDSDSNE